MKVSEAVSNLERRRFRRMGGETPWLENYGGQVVIPKCHLDYVDPDAILVGAEARVVHVMTTADLVADDWELEMVLPLEPCPFCHCSHLEVQKSKGEKVKWVYCFSCNAEGPGMKTEMEAVEKWNPVSRAVAGTISKCGGACTCR